MWLLFNGKINILTVQIFYGELMEISIWKQDENKANYEILKFRVLD